jgi:hypothetical protein
MSEFQVIEEMDEMVKRFGADRITQQAGLEQNLFALPMPSEEQYEAPPAKMRTARPIVVKRMRGIDKVNTKNGAPGGLGLVASGGARNRRSSVKRFSGQKLPSTLNGNLIFSIDEFEMAQGPEAVDAVLTVLDAAGSGAGKYLARSFVDPQVDTVVDAGAALNATSFDVDVANGYWAGQDYVVVRAGAILFQFRCADVIPDFDGGATIVIEDDDLCPGGAIPSALVAATDTIFLLGQSSVDDRTIGSIDEFTDNTVDLYDLPQERFPAGLRKNLGAGWGHEDGRKLCSIVYQSSGRWPTHWLTSPLGRDGIVNDQIDNVRYIMGQGDGADMDPYSDAMAPVFNGLPVIAEPCYDDDVVDLINANFLTLREYWPYLPRRPDGSAARGGDRSVLVLDHDNAAVLGLFDGGYGSVTTNRRATARFTGVTVS